MKKIYTSLKIVLVVIGICESSIINAQTNTWTWVSGADTAWNPNDFCCSIPYVKDSTAPSARAYSANWTDGSGNLWLFGGVTFNGIGNDLWKFDINTNKWTLLSGADTGTTVIYGKKGLADAANIPGARDSAQSWTDNNGDFWLFGGNGIDAYRNNGRLNDLWKYSPSSNLWTWVAGSDSVWKKDQYVSLGTASPQNAPGAYARAIGWTGPENNLWLLANALWKYNISDNLWTCVPDTVLNKTDSCNYYGNLAPHQRMSASAWLGKDSSLWLFGGFYYYNIFPCPTFSQNDLWNYNTTTNTWGLMPPCSRGSYYPSYYSSQGVYSPQNLPPVRVDAASWTDSLGNLWLFGGASSVFNPCGMAGMDPGPISYYNDLLQYNVNLKQWAWVNGSDTANSPGVYGTQGLSSSDNTPGARAGAVSWTDKKGNLWLFGGYENSFIYPSGFYNDLWRYSPSLQGGILATINAVKAIPLPVYPNPSNGNFTVDLPETTQLSVYNTLGELIVTENLPKGKQALNLANKPVGVYYLKANSNNGQQAVKLVVE